MTEDDGVRMIREGKGFFLIAIVFVVISTAIFVSCFPIALTPLLPVKEDGGGYGDAIAIIFLLFEIVWIFWGEAFGVFSVLFSCLALKYTKWSILLIVLSSLYVVAPWVTFYIIAWFG